MRLKLFKVEIHSALEAFFAEPEKLINILP